MLIDTALEIMDAVRAFYAGVGPKSGNKVYMKSTREMLTEDELEQKRTSLQVKMFGSYKLKKRNRDRKRFFPLRFYGEKNTSILERGRSIWLKGVGGDEIAGNCQEMAFVSAYLAIEAHQISRMRVWCGAICPPGDHLFCLICSEGKPIWGTVDDMRNCNRLAVIIDPWLHVASSVRGYPDAAARTIRKWHRAGKRICWLGDQWDGKDESKAVEGWYDPSQTYQRCFRSSPVGYRGAEEIIE